MSTTNPTAPPEAQEPYLILNTARNQWWGQYERGLTSDVGAAGRYPEDFARRHAEGSPFLRAVPLSDALRDGPPVGSQEPKPGQVWITHYGAKVVVVAVERGMVRYTARHDTSFEFVCTLAHWYSNNGVRPLFSRAPNHGEADNHADPHGAAWQHPVHRGEPKPIPESVRIVDAGRIEGPAKGWGPSPLPYEPRTVRLPIRSDVEAPMPAKPLDAYDLVAHLHRQQTFSRRTFGPGPTVARILDHARKEIAEIERDPTDLEEWIDLATLAFDGAWRQGYTSGEIAAAFEAKLRKNEGRTWPDWRTADPDKAIEHVRGGEPPNGGGDDE